MYIWASYHNVCVNIYAHPHIKWKRIQKFQLNFVVFFNFRMHLICIKTYSFVFGIYNLSLCLPTTKPFKQNNLIRIDVFHPTTKLTWRNFFLKDTKCLGRFLIYLSTSSVVLHRYHTNHTYSQLQNIVKTTFSIEKNRLNVWEACRSIDFTLTTW